MTVCCRCAFPSTAKNPVQSSDFLHCLIHLICFRRPPTHALHRRSAAAAANDPARRPSAFVYSISTRVNILNYSNMKPLQVRGLPGARVFANCPND